MDINYHLRYSRDDLSSNSDSESASQMLLLLLKRKRKNAPNYYLPRVSSFSMHERKLEGVIKVTFILQQLLLIAIVVVVYQLLQLIDLMSLDLS